MRVLNPKSGLFLLLFWAASPGNGQPLTEAIDLKAASSSYDRDTGHLIFNDVKISQGNMSVSADLAEATELEFENAAWTFTGKVNISTDETRISGQKAVVDFRNHLLVRASVNGKPATINWESSENDDSVVGQANELVYDRQSGTLRLDGNALVSSSKSEISGNTLLYDLNAEQVVAGSQDEETQGVRITITPDETDQGAPIDDKPTASEGESLDTGIAGPAEGNPAEPAGEPVDTGSAESEDDPVDSGPTKPAAETEGGQ